MGIICLCPNGHRTKLKDRFAGLRVRCPKCGDKFQVPKKNLLHGSKTNLQAPMPATQQTDFESPFNDDHALSNNERVHSVSSAPTNLHPAMTPPILEEDKRQLWRIASSGGVPSGAMTGPDLLALLSSSEISWLDW